MKQLIILSQIIILITAFKAESIVPKSVSKETRVIDWTCPKMDTALIVYEVISSQDQGVGKLIVNYQYEICNKCDLIPFKSFEYDSSQAGSTITEHNSTLDSYYSYYFEVLWKSNDPAIQTQVVCDRFLYRKFGECGVYNFRINMTEIESGKCTIDQIQDPKNSDIYMILAVGLMLLFVGITTIIEANHKQIESYFKSKWRKIFANKTEAKESQAEIQLESNTSKVESIKESDSKPAKKRLKALDTFRGLSLFLMIFVNYGSGKYLHILNLVKRRGHVFNIFFYYFSGI